MKKTLLFITYNVLILLFLFGLLEIGTRLIWGRPYRYDVNLDLIWVSKPNQKNGFFHPLAPGRFSTDAERYRVTNERLKDPDVRILAVGDSYTFGWGVDDADSWPAVVEADLRKNGIRANVYNAGNGGYSTEQILTRWEQQVDNKSFDYVIFGLMPSDELRFQPKGAKRVKYVKQRRNRNIFKSSSFIAAMYQIFMKQHDIGRAYSDEDRKKLEKIMNEVTSEKLWTPHIPRWENLVHNSNSGRTVVVQLMKDDQGFSEYFINHVQSVDELPFLNVVPALDSLAATGVEINGEKKVAHYTPAANRLIGDRTAAMLTKCIRKEREPAKKADHPEKAEMKRQDKNTAM